MFYKVKINLHIILSEMTFDNGVVKDELHTSLTVGTKFSKNPVYMYFNKMLKIELQT